MPAIFEIIGLSYQGKTIAAIAEEYQRVMTDLYGKGMDIRTREVNTGTERGLLIEGVKATDEKADMLKSLLGAAAAASSGVTLTTDRPADAPESHTVCNGKHTVNFLDALETAMQGQDPSREDEIIADTISKTIAGAGAQEMMISAADCEQIASDHEKTCEDHCNRPTFVRKVAAALRAKAQTNLS